MINEEDFFKALFKDNLTEMVSIIDKIDWKDPSINGLFQDELQEGVKKLSMSLYSIYGFQQLNKEDEA